MGNSAVQKYVQIREYCNKNETTSFFHRQQGIKVTEKEVNISIEFAIHARKEHYHSIKNIWKFIHPLMLYLSFRR